MRYLVPDTLEELQIAGLFVREMEEDIYPSGAPKEEMAKTPPAVTVTTDPARIETESCVMFALRFDRRLLNEASAREEWKCTWNLGDNTRSETGWEVFHSFTSAGRKDIQILLSDLNDNPVTGTPISASVIVNDPAGAATGTSGRLWKFVRPSPETLLELIRTILFLALAMIALMATAQQKIANLSFIGAVGAIVALGFGVDLVKSLALQNTSGNTSGAPHP